MLQQSGRYENLIEDLLSKTQERMWLAYLIEPWNNKFNQINDFSLGIPKAEPFLYGETNLAIENVLSKAKMIVLHICVPMYTLPQCAASFYKYFVQDASESAFQLAYDKS